MKLPKFAIATASVFFFFLPIKLQAQESIRDQLKWMLGDWYIIEMGTYESWVPEGNELHGTGFKINNGDTTVWETIKIFKRSDALVYQVSVKGQNDGEAVDFKLVKLHQNKAVFTNPQHDFPQEIVYYLDESRQLKAAVKGKLKGEDKSMEYRFVPASEAEDYMGGPVFPKKSMLGESMIISMGVSNLEASVAFYKSLGFEGAGNLLKDGSMILMLEKSSEPFIGVTYGSSNTLSRAKILRERGLEFFTDDSNTAGGETPLIFTDADSLIKFKLVQSQSTSKSTKPMSKGALGTFGELALPVDDYNKALNFFTSIGFVKMGEFNEPYRWGIVSDGLIVIGLHQTEDFDKAAITYFSMDSKKYLEDLLAKGLDVREIDISGSSGMTNGSVKSPDGWPVFIFYGNM